MKLIIAFAFLAFFASVSLAQDTTQQTLNAQGWIQQNSGTADQLHGLSCPSTDTAWVTTSGPFILRTTNAGQNWVQYPVPGVNAVASISAIDGKTAWAGGVVGDGNVYFTQDGGQSWLQQKTNINNDAIEGIAFPTRNTGYGVGGTLGFVIKTTNGGQTWTNYTLGPGYLYTVNFLDSLNGLIAGDGIMYRIINGGPGRIVQKDTSFALAVLYGCQLVSQNLEFAVGSETVTPSGPYPAIIVRSKDGGKTWDKKKPVGDTTAGFEGIAFTDSLHGTVVGTSGLIFRTIDGGDTWIKQESGVTGWLYSVSFTDSLTGTIVGSGGIILRTTNGGYSWVQPNNNLDSLSVQMYPDPANQAMNFQYNLPVPQSVTLTIFDIAGNSVGIILNNVFQTSGMQTVPINVSQFGTGTYYYQLQTNKYFSTGQFTVVH